MLKEGAEHEQHSRDVAFAEEAGLCVGSATGGPYRNRGWWFPQSRVIDFGNPAAREWWFRKRAYLLDHHGIDGFKTDGGEHLWGRDVVDLRWHLWGRGRQSHTRPSTWPHTTSSWPTMGTRRH